jgi:thiamine thiazole synthase
MDPMWVDDGENRVDYKTGQVFPGLVVTGMAVTETHGLARMGPTYGSMLLSGKKAAEVTAAKIKELRR